jgi:hypothetical protein
MKIKLDPAMKPIETTTAAWEALQICRKLYPWRLKRIVRNQHGPHYPALYVID